MRRKYGQLWGLVCWALCAVAHASDTVLVATFEDHSLYVEATDTYGLSWKIIVLAAADADIHLESVETSWRGALTRLKANKVDLVFGALKTPERDQWAQFSAPLIAEGSAVFGRLEDPAQTLTDIDLEQVVVGVSANSVQEEQIRELGFHNVYSTVVRPQLYEMLNTGRLDYLFFGRGIIQYFCAKYATADAKGCMKQIGPLYQPNHIHMMGSLDNRNTAQLLARLNASLLRIADTDPVRALFAQYGKDAKAHCNWLTVLRQTPESAL